MNKQLILTLLLLLAGGVKTLASVGLALYFLAVSEGGPLAFLLPYAEVMLLGLVASSYLLGRKPSAFEQALRQEKARSRGTSCSAATANTWVETTPEAKESQAHEWLEAVG